MRNIDNSILAEIKETIESMFSIIVTEHMQINRGLLNLKWKATTSQGTYFIKQYNTKRYPASQEQRMNRLNTALWFQRSLSEKGIRCPSIFTKDGNVILQTKQNTRFIVTAFEDGSLVSAGQINCSQFHDLGIELGKMHGIVNDHIDNTAIPRWIVPTKEQLMGKWNENWTLTNAKNTTEVNAYLKLQKEIFESMDMNLFEGSKPGWAHSDLWCDNVLFYTDSLCAMIDFDRFQYIYPEMDVARAVLSFALDHNCLRIDAVKAFVDGYNKFGHITKEELVRSLKLLYCLESFYWINNDSFFCDGPPNRFAHEMVWLSINWHHLEKIIGA